MKETGTIVCVDDQAEVRRLLGEVFRTRGREVVLSKVGVAPTGESFNSLLDEGANRAPNPMVNAGAIATTSLVPASSATRC